MSGNKQPEYSGGNVNYYLVEVKDPKRLEPYTAEAEDIIEALGMNFAEGCAFKAIWRSCAARKLGLFKSGMDMYGVYDAEKVQYYGARMLAINSRVRDAGLAKLLAKGGISADKVTITPAVARSWESAAAHGMDFKHDPVTLNPTHCTAAELSIARSKTPQFAPRSSNEVIADRMLRVNGQEGILPNG